MDRTIKSKYRSILSFVFAPLFTGFILYFIYGRQHLLFFELIKMDYLLDIEIDQFLHLPRWIINYLPDLLWAFSCASLICIIWQKELLQKINIWITIPFLSGCLFEFGQKVHIIEGTYDTYDILSYFLGNVLAICINSLQNKSLIF